MTKEYLISANNIADMERYTNEYLPIGGETLTKYDATPVVVTFEPDPVAGEWNYNHTFVAEFPTADAARAWQHDETFNSEKLEQLRDAVFDEHNFFFASEFDPGDFE
ncbi:DUF1330 domain-containing protein [Natrialbaceae archaeon A-chndr2]